MGMPDPQLSATEFAQSVCLLVLDVLTVLFLTAGLVRFTRTAVRGWFQGALRLHLGLRLYAGFRFCNGTFKVLGFQGP